MAAPNIVNVSSIIGKTSFLAVGTSAAAVVENSAGSGKVFKINTLVIANLTSVGSFVTIDVYRSSAANKLINLVLVPPSASFSAIDKNTAIYLEEGDQLRITASDSSTLTATCSYEEIS
jgi:hypothetical protein